MLLVGFSALYLVAAMGPFHLPRPPAYSEDGGAAQVEGLIASEVFTAPDALPFSPPSQRVLWGNLGRVQSLSARTFLACSGLLFAVFIGAAALGLRARTRHAGIAVALSALILLSGLASLRVSGGWDEFYINLRHSQNIIDHGMYSVNAGERIESTVDLVPFLAAGAVSKLTGVLPDNIAFAFGFLGNILIVAAVFAFARKLTQSDAGSLVIAAFASVFPPVIFVGASGFMATLFAGCILWTYFLLLEKRGRWSFRAHVLLGLLPLVRLEAIALGLLVWGLLAGAATWTHRTAGRRLHSWLHRSWRIFAWRLLAVLLPFVLLSVARRAFFGYAIPIPVAFKNTQGEVDYLIAGAVQLREFYAIFGLGPMLLVAAVPTALLLAGKGRRYWAAYSALTLFSLTYLVGGGDWFPGGWARYWIPLLSFTFLLASTAVYVAVAAWNRRIALWTMTALLMLFAAVYARRPGSAYSDAVARLRTGGNGWERVDQLARLGSLLGQTSATSWRIGSPEVATIMFFAHRDLVGLLGIDNPDVALAPLAPMIPGDRLHRRRRPETLEERKPEVLALYDPAVRNRAFTDLERLQADVRELMFTQRMQDIAYYRVGSYDYIQALGFRSLTVQAGSDLFTYWVHELVLPAHRDKLAAAGFTPRGMIHVPYDIDPRLSWRFRPTSARLAGLHRLRRDASVDVTWADSPQGPGQSSIGGPRQRRATYSSWRATAGHRETLRMVLGASDGMGELRLPLALGPDANGITIHLAHAVSHAVVREIPVPQGLSNRWLTVRIEVPVTPTPLELVVTDGGTAVGQWFAVAAPWWMGEKPAPSVVR